MHARSGTLPRLRRTHWVMCLLLGASLFTGCHKDKTADAKKAEGSLNGDATRKSLEGLKPKLEALNVKFAALHKQIDPLPPNLPGFGDVRTKFYNTDIGMGV